MRILRSFLALLILAGILSCGGDGEDSASPLALTMEVPSEARIGDALHMVLRLTNRSDQPVTIDLWGRPAYNFGVHHSLGGEVWRSGFGEAVFTVLSSPTLQGGEVMEFDAEWSLVENGGEPISPGRYMVYGFLRSEPVLPAPAVILTVTP